jgi:hypothetical protein
MYHERKYHLEDNGIAAMSGFFRKVRCCVFPSQQSGAGRWIYRDKAGRNSSHIDMNMGCIHHDAAEFVDQ